MERKFVRASWRRNESLRSDDVTKESLYFSLYLNNRWQHVTASTSVVNIARDVARRDEIKIAHTIFIISQEIERPE